jgi:hypothetical protein
MSHHAVLDLDIGCHLETLDAGPRPRRLTAACGTFDAAGDFDRFLL